MKILSANSDLGHQKLTCEEVCGSHSKITQPYNVTPGSVEHIFLTEEEIVFNTNVGVNDLQGSLKACIHFAQSQVIPVQVKETDPQPHLIAQRATLLIVQLLHIDLDLTVPLKVTIKNGQKLELATLSLDPPCQLPKTAYCLGPDGEVDFNPAPGSTYTIESLSEIEKLSDPQGIFLLEKLQTNAMVEIKTGDNRWVENIYLPSDTTLDSKVVILNSTAQYRSIIEYSGRSITLSNKETRRFKFLNGQWFCDGEMYNNGIVYAKDAWSTKLSPEWILPGVTLSFSYGSLNGELINIPVGAPTEILINAIDIGMLVEPRGEFDFYKDAQAHREYFQCVPTSKLIVNQYESIYLKEVMLPDGTLLDSFDPSVGGIYDGTMRQRIGKELISIGINNANYGINTSVGVGEEGHPYSVAQITAHNSCGMYSNDFQVHGFSGGGGIVTLANSLGNEFSHELGHNYELPHYPGGFEGSVHRAASEINSTWGWDQDRNKFLPNFSPVPTGQNTCLDGKCQAPFYGRRFGNDAMASGFEPPIPSYVNRFTLHTPYAATFIQRFLEGKMVFAPDSPTGYRKWDPATLSMLPHSHRVNVVNTFSVSITNEVDLSESELETCLENYGVVRVALRDNYWAKNIYVPRASSGNRDTIITVDHEAGYSSTLHINGESINLYGIQKTYSSDGTRWNESMLIDARVGRISAPITNEVDLNEVALIPLLEQYGEVIIYLKDYQWVENILVPQASSKNKSRVITVEHDASYNSILHLNGGKIEISKGFKKSYVSDGTIWNEEVIIDLSIERIPQAFSVPVTTIVGYYDPENLLKSYIYPALHGAYGFCYKDDTETVDKDDCQLHVETSNGVFKFKLFNNRENKSVMNKFHINIPRINQPTTVYILCDDVILAQRVINPNEDELTYTISGT